MKFLSSQRTTKLGNLKLNMKFTYVKANITWKDPCLGPN